MPHEPDHHSLVRLQTAIPPSRPAFSTPPCAGAVNDGRRPPPKAAHSVIDRTKHGGNLVQVHRHRKQNEKHSCSPGGNVGRNPLKVGESFAGNREPIPSGKV
jgi:hypothetical protein